MTQNAFTDKEIMTDVLSSQKQITETYNTFTNECESNSLRTDFLNILREEHNIQQSVYDQMKSRGWFAPPAAQQQAIDTAKNKFLNISQSL